MNIIKGSADLRGFTQILILIFCFPCLISAQYFHTPPLLAPYMESAPEIVSRAAVLVDAATGALLYSKNGDEEIPPASLAKLMTMHLLMNEIREGRASYDDVIPITPASWAQNQPPQSSLMFLEPGQTVTLREILLGLAVSSGNDAAVAAALYLTPSMDAFAELMTLQARKMGLNVTRFTESSGYSNQNMTTANEFAYFSYQYVNLYPDSMRDFHSLQEFSYPLEENVPESKRDNPRTITQYNRNRMLWSFPGVDGLKTGFIPDSGYNISLTAQRDNTRFVLVLLGAPSQRGGDRIRQADGTRIFNWAFEKFKTVSVNIGTIENVRLWKGKEKSVQLTVKDELLAVIKDGYALFTSPTDRADAVSYETVITDAIIAPLPAGFIVGFIVISDEYGELHRLPLMTAKDYSRGNVFKRIWHSVLLRSGIKF